MNLLFTTFGSVAVLLGIGTLGFWIIRRRILAEQALGSLSPLALDIAMPCLIFVNMVTNFSPKETPDWWVMTFAWVGFASVAALLTFSTMYVANKNVRREFAISLFYQNGIFFPLAVLNGMFPQDPSYLVYLFLFMLFYPAFFFNTYHFFFPSKHARLDWQKICNPVLIASLVAISIRLLNVQMHIPDFLISICRLLGNMTIPVIMIILGGSVYLDLQQRGSVRLGEIVKFVFVKNFVFPIIFLLILSIVRPNYSLALIVFLESAVPPVSAVPILAERAGGNRSIVNQFVVSSIITSLISIPLMVMLFSKFFAP